MCSECCWREGGFGEPVTHSQLSFPHRRGCCRRVYALAVSLPLSVPLKLVFLLVFFFSHMVCWTLPPGRLDFHNYSLVCGYLPSAALSRFSPTTADRGWGRLLVLPPISRSVCLSVPKCTSGQDSSQVVCHLLLLDPTSSIETLLWMDA